MELPEYTGKTGHQTRTTRTYIPIIYNIISEISIDMNKECARSITLIIGTEPRVSSDKFMAHVVVRMYILILDLIHMILMLCNSV